LGYSPPRRRQRRIHIRAIGGTSNHVHLLLDLPSTRSVADVLRELKANSSARIRRETTNFGWQDGYGAQRASFGGSKRDWLHQPLITRYFPMFF
jgi:REP element-mobilizing transposase RayT